MNSSLQNGVKVAGANVAIFQSKIIKSNGSSVCNVYAAGAAAARAYNPLKIFKYASVIIIFS